MMFGNTGSTKHSKGDFKQLWKEHLQASLKDDGEEVRRVLAEMKRLHPEAFERHKSFPKYSQPNGYRSIRDMPDMMTMIDVDFRYRLKLMGAEALDQPVATAAGVVDLITDLKYPLYFCTPEIVEAALNTDLPDWLDFKDLKWPLQAMTFVLPQGQIKTSQGREVMLVSVCGWTPEIAEVSRMRASLENAMHKTARLDLNQERLENGTTAIWAELIDANKAWTIWTMDRAMKGPVAAATVNFRNISDFEDTSDEDEMLLSSINTIAYNLVMMMTARPELVEPASPLKTVKNKATRQRETLWKPRFLGKGYHAARRKYDSAGGQGTHASPRSHWRRGHYRNQACGPLRQEHKIIWIEPVLIGGV